MQAFWFFIFGIWNWYQSIQHWILHRVPKFKFLKVIGMVPNLKIWVKIFLKCPLWYVAAKLENIWNKIFSQEVDQESSGWSSICQILILPLWFVTPPCLLVKLSQILQKVIVFFPERGEKIKTSFWHVWIAQWQKFFPTIAYFFRFWPFSGRKEGWRLDQKC